MELKRTLSGWELTIEGFTEAGALGAYIWPDGVPAGVKIVPLIVVEEPSQIGTFQLTGITTKAVQEMEPSFGKWFAQEGSGVAVKMDEDELLEYVHKGLEGTHWIGGTAEVVGVFAAEGSTLAAVAEMLGPVGEVASLIILYWAVIRAFGTGKRLEKAQGFCYGLMWETFGMPDGAKTFRPWPPDTAEDHREAFYDGVEQGREKARDVKVHNAIMMAVAYYMVTHKSSEDYAQFNVLNELWKRMPEVGEKGMQLTWPKPVDDADILQFFGLEH